MLKNIESFDDFKRTVYLFILPFVFIATTLTLFMQLLKHDYTFDFYANGMFIAIASMGWFLARWKRRLKLFEYSILIYLFIYHLSMVSIEVFDSIGAEGERTLSTFVIWTPLIIMFTFVVLEKWRALAAISLLLVLSMVPEFLVYDRLSVSIKASLIHLHISTAIYIIILFFANRMFEAHAETNVIRRQLYLDALTQIGNRYQIDKWMETSIVEADEDGCFSILFFDIDRFKSVNDRFGHQIGDDVLKKAVRIVQGEMREGELFGRWGGEEFLVILQVPVSVAYRVAERLRQAIEQHDFGEVGQVTASFGVASYQQGDTCETILVRADERLYVSKEEGRNRVTGKMLSQNEE
ncbi:GGDEF domain-containing protein [Sporosarcina sp. NPDC096371]|uniref:GGDEF domain-containing protein n=1 Tax=Sporosarcina sp. NPDC096371 TaxID=3364530 RepID=UPI0037F57BC5